MDWNDNMKPTWRDAGPPPTLGEVRTAQLSGSQALSSQCWHCWALGVSRSLGYHLHSTLIPPGPIPDERPHLAHHMLVFDIQRAAACAGIIILPSRSSLLPCLTIIYSHLPLLLLSWRCCHGNPAFLLLSSECSGGRRIRASYDLHARLVAPVHIRFHPGRS